MKGECNVEDVFDVTARNLNGPGLLLTSCGLDSHYNVMTIGWGLVGRLWREPVFVVAVRPSRHTFKLIEETNEFTVNVPADDMDETVAFCGKVSGRDRNKIKERGLPILDGRRVQSPIIASCVAHFECKVIGKVTVTSKMLSPDTQNVYPSGNYHTLYIGKLLSVFKDNP